MESESAARDLTDLHRAQVLTHTRSPRLGRWYPPLVGLVGGLWAAGLALPGPAAAVLWTSLAVATGLGTALYTRRRGVQPDPRRAPGPIRREMLLFAAGAAVVVLGLTALQHVAPWWAVALATAMALGIGTAVYESRYARAARQAEKSSVPAGL